jgi:hypothetical protein
MTNEIVFKTRVDTGTTSKDLAAINTELGKIDESAKTVGTDSAAQLQSLNAKIKAGGLSARELSRSIKEYMTIAIQAGTETPVGKEAIANASQLKDDLRGLGEEVSRLKDGAAGMQAALQLGSTVVAGYSVAQGSMAMFGIESEKLMETMVKLQSATAVLTGLQQIHTNLEKESFLMLKAKALQTKVMTVLTGAYSAAVGTSTGALKLFRLALIATGIGAIIVAVGLLIANFDKLVEYVMKGVHWFNKLGTGIKIALSIMLPFVGIIWGAIEALKYFGIIQTEEATRAQVLAAAKQKALIEETAARRKMVDDALAENKRLQSSLEKHYDFEIAKAKAAGKDTFELEKEKRAEMRRTLEAQILLLEESLKLNANNATAMMKIIKDMAAVRSAITESEQQDELAGIQRSTDARKKAAENKKNIDKTQEEETAKALERERLLRDYFIASIDDENIQKLEKLKEQHKREREELVKKYGEDAELIKAMEGRQFDEMNALRKERAAALLTTQTEENRKQFELQRRDEMAALQVRLVGLQDDFEAEMEVKRLMWEMERDEALSNADLTENEKLLIKANYNQKILDADKERLAKEVELEKQVVDEKERIQKQLYDSINNLTETAFIIGDALGKQDEKSKEKRARAQFKITKAMQLGMAINDGYKAITASLAQSPVAIGAVPNPAGIASLAFAASTAAVNVAKIAASKFEGGGGAITPPEPPTIPQVGAPEIPQEPNAQTTQTAGLVGGNKVVVVDSEIKAVMDNSQQIQVVSSFG